MENQTKINAVIISLLAILATYSIIGDNEPTHYSDSLQVKMYCDRLSSTNKTCYPTPGVTLGKKYSSDGWKEIPFIQEEIPLKSNGPRGRREVCNPKGCRSI